MLNRLINTQDRSKADFTSFEQTTPMIAGVTCEELSEPCLQSGPLIAIVLCGRIDVIELQLVQERNVELRF
jgi:hypothetical protein